MLVCRREALRNLPVSQLHRLQQNKLFSQHFMRKDSPGGLNLKFARVLKRQNINVTCFFISWRNWSSWRKPCKHRENMQPPHMELQCYLLLWGKSASHWTPALVLWPCQYQTGLRVIHTDRMMSRSGFCVLLLCFWTEFGNHPFF